MSNHPARESGAVDRMLRVVDHFGREVHLSGRQMEMLKLAVTGVHRKEAAARLGCSLKTVEGYWRRIFDKTGCQTDAEVVARFFRRAVVRGRQSLARPALDHHR